MKLEKLAVIIVYNFLISGDSAASLNKSLLSFKPKNKIKPGRPDSPEDDSELAIVDF